MKNNHSLKPKNDSFKPILIVILCTLLTAAGQILLKSGANKISNFYSIFNWSLIIGCIIYAVGAVLLIIALKYGDLSLIYPFIALSFVWVTIASIYIFDEKVMLINWSGIIFIILGVSFIGWGAKK